MADRPGGEISTCVRFGDRCRSDWKPFRRLRFRQRPPYTGNRMRPRVSAYRYLAVAFVIFLAATPAASGEVLRFQGDLARGQTFRKAIGHGLELILGGNDNGWTIIVSPQTPTDHECDDFTWVVNPPFRAYNDLYLYPGYGLTAQDAVDRSPREFNFVLNCAGFKRESTFVRRLIESTPAGFPRSEKEIAEAQAKIGTSPQGHGTLWILDSKVSPAPEDIEGKNYGQIDRIRFRVEIRLPKMPTRWPCRTILRNQASLATQSPARCGMRLRTSPLRTRRFLWAPRSLRSGRWSRSSPALTDASFSRMWRKDR